MLLSLHDGSERLSPVIKAFASLSLPPVPSSDTDLDVYQRDLVEHVLMSEHFVKYPPSGRFQRAFWKRVIDQLELGGQEVDERIYERYLELLTATSSHLLEGPPAPSYVTYFYVPDREEPNPHTQSITLLESRTTIEAGTTGLRTWQASFVFADWLIANRLLLKDKRVLELGSGAGFLGTLVGQLQLNTQSSGTLVMTDVNSKVLERCALNLKLDCNGLLAHSSLSLKPLNWFDALPEALTRPYVEQLLRDRAPDLVIGADLVYDPSVIPALCATLQLALSLPRSRVEQAEGLLALTVRREATIEEFMIQCAYHGLEVEGMALAPALETGFTSTMPKDLHGVDEVRLLRIRYLLSSS